jgi:hypothetical protein
VPAADTAPARPVGPRGAEPRGLPVRAVTAPLRVADETPPGSRGWGNQVGRRYVLVPDPDRPGVRGSDRVFVERIADRARVLTHVTSAPDRHFYRIFFWGDVAVVAENGDELRPAGPRISLFRYDLATGSRSELAVPGRPLGYLNAADVYGGQLGVPAALDGQDDRCLHRFDLHTGAGADLYCFPPGQRIYTVRAADGGFTVVTHTGSDLTGCRAAYHVPLTGGTARRFGDAACWSLDHAHLADWDVWSYTEDLAPTAALHASTATRRVTLGPVRINSVVRCGGYLYWLRPATTGADVVRWRPGADHVEAVYLAAELPPGGLVQVPVCNEDVLATGYSVDRPPARRIVYLPPV